MISKLNQRQKKDRQEKGKMM